MKILKKLFKLPARFAVFLISAYQFLLSPDHSWLRASYPYGFCRHYPSCSEYSKLSIVNFGLFKGIFLGAKRLSRCHPFAEPSVDPVPNNF